MLDKLATGIGYVILMLGGFYVIAILSSYMLDVIIIRCKFGKEFYRYCDWKRKQNRATGAE